MSFVYAAALAIALLAAGPFVAHLLRRRKADERDFPPARLVPPSPPVARQRHRVDDRALYAVRTLAVLALALLGATPFVRCSGLALGRHGGASVALAIVLDDSLSMQTMDAGKTRFDRARSAAADLVSGARSGDAIALVLAGAPARVALASTTDLAAARAAVEQLAPSHRATDLDGAVALARSLVRGLPQVDRRVVVLSDLADGKADGPPLGDSDDVAVWVPLESIAEPGRDCAVVRADRQRDRVAVRVACSPDGAGAGRSLEIKAGDKVFGRAALPAAGGASDLTVEAPGAPEGAVAELTGADPIAADDRAPVLESASALAIAVVADPSASRAATGGPPVVEQALAALELDAQVKPLPLVPDRIDDAAGLAAMILDDPAGLTPEARRSLSAFVTRGGVVLVTLGPHAASAPLGATFEPFVSGAVGWGASAARGIDEKTAGALFGAASAGLADLSPHGRATIDEAAQGAQTRVVGRWSDGAPWLLERTLGRGLAFVLTMPTSPAESDLALRPAFLALLDTVVEAARARTGAVRGDVGRPWAFEGARSLEVRGPGGARLPIRDEPTRKIATPELAGTYEVTLDGEKRTRVAAVPEREIDLRPRRVVSGARSSSLGEVRAKVDASPYVAVALLALMVAELALRLWIRRESAKSEPTALEGESHGGGAQAGGAP